MATWNQVATDDCSGAGAAFDGRTTTTGSKTWEAALSDCETDGSGKGVGGSGTQHHVSRLTTAEGDNQRVGVGETSNQFVGPCARVQADGTCYFVGAASKFGAWTLYEIVGANDRNVIASGSNRSGTEGAEIRVEGTSYAVHIGGSGTADFSGTDTTFSTGNPGVSSLANNIEFDDWEYFEDTDESAATPTPTPTPTPAPSRPFRPYRRRTHVQHMLRR